MSTKTKSKAQVALVDTASKGVRAAPMNGVSDFALKLIRFPNSEKATVIIEEQAALEYDAQYPELHKVTIQQPELDKLFEASTKHMEELERTVREIPREIKNNSAQAGTDKKKVGFWKWSLLDKMSVVLLLPAGLACLLMSGMNVFSNLISSGEPIYIENMIISIAISSLAPACSLSFKFLGGIFEYSHRGKKRFTHFMFLSSAASSLIWIALFSAAYSGPASNVNWDVLMESSKGDLGTWLAFTQLLTEILIGGALFLALQDICIKYSPDSKAPNPDYLSAVNARDDHLAAHTALRDERNENHQRFTVLKNERQAYINATLVDFIYQQARFASMNDF